MEQVVIAHISDLHLGASPVPRRVPRFTGRRAHDYNLCEPLYFALRTAREEAQLSQDEPLHMIVSGDLTSGGSLEELRLMRQFLHARTVLPDSEPGDPTLFGLGIARDENFVSIPGNHDHADDGRWLPPLPVVRAFNPGIYPVDFENGPLRIWSSASGTILVELYGIDSAGGLSGTPTNFRANGSFSDADLGRLEDALTSSERHAVPIGVRRLRLLVCHHSLWNEERILRRMIDAVPASYTDEVLAKNTLDDYSYHRLLELAVKYRVSAILSGHIHRFEERKLPRRRDGALLRIYSDVVLEFTSSTTLQEPARDEIGFWLHRIRLAGLRLEWVRQKFLYKALAGHFYPQPPLVEHPVPCSS